MWANKGRLRLAALAMAAFLCVCGPGRASQLIDPEQIEADEVRYKTDTAVRGEMLRTASGSGSRYFPHTETVFYRGDQATFQEWIAHRGDTVKAGDPLIRVSVQYDAVRLQELELELRRAKEDYETGVRDREEALDALRAQADGERDPYARGMAGLTLRQEELRLEKYKLDQDRSIASIEEAIDEMNERRSHGIVYAPIDGIVENTTYFKENEPVYDWMSLCTIASEDVLLIAVSGARLSYGQEVTIDVGPARNRVTTTGRVVAAADVIATLSSDRALILPDDRTPFDETKNNSIVVHGNSVDLKNVLLINRKAVTLNNGRTIVTTLTDDGVTHKRYILTGMITPSEVWVLQGLDEGDVVILD